MISRFFCPLPAAPEGEVALPREVAHHAERVLRLVVGDELVLFGGDGAEYAARLVSLGREPRAEILARRAPERESPLAVTLVQALASGDKMDWVVQKAVELGAVAVAPVAAERSVLKLAGERADKRQAHWRQVAVSACEQCGRNRVPEILPVRTLTACLAEPAGNALRLMLDPAAPGGLGDLGRPTGPVHILIGPEGGWSPAELAAARQAGVRGVRLGPRVLRTETAGLAMLAALQALWGDF
ncbi:MAG: 16S rRNA (uracil(1498)-N(3))-methyltransferase [Rhodocyclaceae bacterium]|jgi:16S rRNA (uracil1498-N3)-methyltransferase|nr:16S rRNA (uracil(1498)-N(3))-methyltransferase [Rhodocyclaceae bacterium]